MSSSVFQQIASRRDDLLVVPFDTVRQISIDRFNTLRADGVIRPPYEHDALLTQIGYVYRNLVSAARVINQTTVLLYRDPDLLGGPGSPLRYRLKGGIQMAYYSPCLVVEAEGKIHVLKDRGLTTLKPIIQAIRSEAPSLIGRTPNYGFEETPEG